MDELKVKSSKFQIGLLIGLGLFFVPLGVALLVSGLSDGHSVSLVLDSGEAFTGDLTPPVLATEEQMETILKSWQSLRDRGARRVYGGHGPVGELKNV